MEMRIILVLIFIINFTSCSTIEKKIYIRSYASTSTIDLNNFFKFLEKTASKIEEIEYIRKVSRSMGIKDLYLSGETASSYGMYIRKYLGILNYERYSLSSEDIFKNSNELNFVIDGTIENLNTLKYVAKEKYPDKKWNIKLLSSTNHPKKSILNNKKTMQEHTHSFASGMINISNCNDINCVKDFRDWDSKESNFLKDIINKEITFYHSEQHKSLRSFESGKNPEILSVVKYYMNVDKHELNVKEQDIEPLGRIINGLEPFEHDFVYKTIGEENLKWIKENAMDMVNRSVDVNFFKELSKPSSDLETIFFDNNRVLVYKLKNLSFHNYDEEKKAEKLKETVGFIQKMAEAPSYSSYDFDQNSIAAWFELNESVNHPQILNTLLTSKNSFIRKTGIEYGLKNKNIKLKLKALLSQSFEDRSYFLNTPASLEKYEETLSIIKKMLLTEKTHHVRSNLKRVFEDRFWQEISSKNKKLISFNKCAENLQRRSLNLKYDILEIITGESR